MFIDWAGPPQVRLHDLMPDDIIRDLNMIVAALLPHSGMLRGDSLRSDVKLFLGSSIHIRCNIVRPAPKGYRRRSSPHLDGTDLSIHRFRLIDGKCYIQFHHHVERLSSVVDHLQAGTAGRVG